MKKIFLVIITLTMLLAFATASWGMTFGARAAGMGGAFTAVADDSTAAYWNPAGITQTKTFSLTLGTGFQGDIEGMQELMDSLYNPTYPLEIPSGVETEIPVYVGFTTKNFGLNFLVDSSLSTTTNGDHIDKILTQQGGSLVGTIALPLEHLAIGGNIKLVSCMYRELFYQWDGNPGTFDPNNNYIIHVAGGGIGVDLGVLVPLTEVLKIGVAARNIYSYVERSGFKTPYDIVDINGPTPQGNVDFIDNRPLPTTYAVGIALRPTNSFLLAADVETTTNSIDPDFNVTLFHVGLEQTLLFKIIALRLGAFTTPEDETGYSAGLGLKLGPLLMDAAVNQVGETLGAYVTAGIKF